MQKKIKEMMSKNGLNPNHLQVPKNDMDSTKKEMEQAKKAIARMQDTLEKIFVLAEKRNDRYIMQIEALKRETAHLQSQIKDLQKII